MTGAVVLAAVIVAVFVRACRTDARRITAYQRREQTAGHAMADLARWRADQRMRDTREDPAKCEAIWRLPVHIPQQRKETGQ